MTIERSHGKARPTLPRSNELPTVIDTDGQRNRGRDARGRFSPGNEGARGRGWKQAIVKMLGRDVDDPAALAVSADAWRLFAASMREMPSDGPTVRSLVALRCRHEALAAYWHARAVDMGLDTDAGIAATEQATKHGQRAERLAVTSIDIAVRMAKSRPTKQTLPPWFVEAPADAMTQDEPSDEPHAPHPNIEPLGANQ